MKNYIYKNQTFQAYKKILPYARPYCFRAIIAMFISIPIGSLDAVIALSLKPYMDGVMVGKSMQASLYIPFAIVGFTLLQGLLNYLSTYTNAWVGGKVSNDIKLELYKKLLSYEPSFFDNNTSGMVVARFSSDADLSTSGLLNNLKMFLSRFFSSISLIGVLIYNSWQLAIIAVFILLLTLLPLTKIRKVLKEVLSQSVFIGADIITTYNETFAGNKTIQAYNLHNIQLNKFNKTLSKIFRLNMKITKHCGWMSPIMHVIASIGIAVVVGYGSHLIITHQITSGNFVSFITALIMLYTPIKTLGSNYASVQSSLLAIDRILEKLDHEPAVKDAENPVEISTIARKISFENISFEYEKGRRVLENVSLDIEAGDTLALVGNSGGGKTTLVNLLPRFYDVIGGKITIDGVDIREIGLKSLREHIAVVFQDNFLFSGTIRDNIVLGNPDATDEEIDEALRNSFLDEFVASLGKGLDTQIGERGILLSGGQKQRVAIARAFIKDAPVIILDEATSALDYKSEAIVQKAIDKLMENRTVIVIAHRLSTVQNATKIAVINSGSVVELGTHEELLSLENGAYKSLYLAQFKDKNLDVQSA
jgi:subfamily B ATP-binding cassette protein MsbA